MRGTLLGGGNPFRKGEAQTRKPLRLPILQNGVILVPLFIREKLKPPVGWLYKCSICIWWRTVEYAELSGHRHKHHALIADSMPTVTMPLKSKEKAILKDQATSR